MMSALQPAEHSTCFIYLLHLAGGTAVTDAQNKTANTWIRKNLTRWQEARKTGGFFSPFAGLCCLSPESWMSAILKPEKLDCYCDITGQIVIKVIRIFGWDSSHFIGLCCWDSGQHSHGVEVGVTFDSWLGPLGVSVCVNGVCWWWTGDLSRCCLSPNNCWNGLFPETKNKNNSKEWTIEGPTIETIKH